MIMYQQNRAEYSPLHSQPIWTTLNNNHLCVYSIHDHVPTKQGWIFPSALTTNLNCAQQSLMCSVLYIWFDHVHTNQDWYFSPKPILKKYHMYCIYYVPTHPKIKIRTRIFSQFFIKFWFESCWIITEEVLNCSNSCCLKVEGKVYAQYLIYIHC